MQFKISASKSEFLQWLFQYELETFVNGKWRQLRIGPASQIESQRINISLLQEKDITPLIEGSIERDDKYRCAFWFDLVVTDSGDGLTLDLVENKDGGKRLMELFAVDVKAHFGATQDDSFTGEKAAPASNDVPDVDGSPESWDRLFEWYYSQSRIKTLKELQNYLQYSYSRISKQHADYKKPQ